MIKLAALMIPVALASSQTALAATAPLMPSGKWVVEWSDSRCTAHIVFKEEGRTVTLVLKAPPKEGSFQLSLAENGGTLPPSVFDTQLSVGTGLSEKVSMLLFGNKPYHIRQINLTAPQIAQLRSATSLTADSGKGSHVYQLTQLPQVAAQLEKCRTDLLAAWNGDATGKGRVEKKFQGSLIKLFSSGDYPSDALRKDQSGAVEMMLLIDVAGKVADCSVTATSGVAALDAQSCAIVIQRSKFKPARDKQGKPIRSVEQQRVNWVTGW